MRRLYTRIYWHFLLVLVVVAALMGGVFATDWRGRMLRDYAERLVTHAASLMAPKMAIPDQRERLARHLADEFGLDVTVRDASYRALTIVGPELPPPTAEEMPHVEAASHHFKHGRGWFVVAPIRDPATSAFLGIVETTRSRRMGGGDLLRPAATVALLLLIVALATAPLARRISRPVERLTEASRRFGDGDLAYRVATPQSGRWRRHHGRRANDELGELTRAWNEMAERIEKLVRGHRELLANVSHELRSPLQRIRVALELLPEDLASTVVSRLDDVKLDLTELERLIDDVLTTSRLEAAGLPTRIDRVDVGALLAALGERARLDPVTAGKEVRVAGAAGAIEVFADGALLKRALWNLIENAAKYGAPPITLAAELRVDRVALSVTDEGAGIAPGERERVLEPFYRADKARTPGAAAGGFGLGLTLARRIAEVHGGTIRVEPAKADSGCRVTVEIPLRAAA